MIDSNVSITAEQDNTVVKFTIKKELSINNATEVKEKLIKAINEYNQIDVILKKIDYIDLPGLQLLVSARKTVVNKGKKITFSFDFSKEMQAIFTNSGFNGLLN